MGGIMAEKKLWEEARLYHQQGRFSEAEKLYLRILEKNPMHAKSKNALGIIAYQRGNIAEAVRLILAATIIRPDFACGYNNLGYLYKRQGQFLNAKDCLEKAIAVRPDYAEALYNLAEVVFTLGQADYAEAYLEKAVAAQPDYVEALFQLAVLNENKSDLAVAERYYQKVLSIQPQHADALIGLGYIAYLQGNFRQAEQYYREVLQFDANHAQALNNMGVIANEQGCAATALKWYDKVLAVNPGDVRAHFNHALQLLKLGDWLAGFIEYEWRLKQDSYTGLLKWCSGKKRWRGEALQGNRLLICDEQGIGGTLQFIRYLPLVKARGGQVLFATKPGLFRLLKDVPGIDIMYKSVDDIKPTDFELYIPLMSLPLVFGTTPDSIPGQQPYIAAAQQNAKYWRERMRGNKLKVGLVWEGNRYKGKYAGRACRLADYARLAEIAGVQFYSLQKGAAAQQVKEELFGLVDFTDEIKDFADTAGVVANLDLVITIDTSVAHLSGSMGKAVWTLLPYTADWRWLENREDSPWYPSMRLFRQSTPGDWGEVVERVCTELKKLAAEHGYEGEAV
jgi:tetratricopeptide (TPR) repeat protein